MNNFLFTKDEVAKLFDANTSSKESEYLLEKADNRFQYIIKTTGKIIGREWAWFDFITETQNNNRGYFCKEEYKHEIDFIGQCAVLKNYNFDKYDNSIPTKWLWTEFESELIREVSQFEKDNTNKNLNKLKK